MAREIKLDEPPRKVPFSAQQAVVFGGITQQIGWAIVLFGLLFGWIFGLDSEAITLIEFRGELDMTDGAVVDVHETAASEGEKTIYGVRYRYRVGEASYEGVSYGFSANFTPGQAVKVQYLVNHPDRSRIEGMRVRKFGPSGIVTVLFPLVGLGLAIRGLFGGLLARRLLKTGRLAFGTLVHKEATNTRITKQTVYKLTFEFSVPKENELFGYRQSATEETEVYQAHHKTHLTAELEDEPEEPLLFDPNNPRRVYPIDGLPGKVKVSAAGHIGAPRSALRTLALPLLGTLGLVAFLIALVSC